MASYPIFPGNGSYPSALAADPWAVLANDRRKQSAGSVPKLPTRVSSTPTTAPVQTPQMTLEDWLRQESSKWLQAQIDAINAQKQAYLDDLRQQQELEIQRGQEAARALQGLNMPGRIQDIYGNLSANTAGLAQAFSGTLRDTATADAAQQQRMVSGTGQEGAVPNNGEALGNVLYGTQGYIPARTAGETGAAFAAQAALEPGFAQRIGQVKGAEAYTQGLEGLRQFTDAILEATGKQGEIEQQLLERYQKAQEAAQPNLTARTLADGRIQWFDEDTGEPVGPPQGPKRSKSSSSASVKTVKLANGQVQAVDPMTGKPIGKPFGPAKDPSSSSKKLTARSLANGQIQWFDPETGQPVGAPQGPKRATTKKTAGGKSYNLQLKTLGDGSQQWFDPRTGKAVGPKISPPKQQPTKRADGVTPTQLRKYKATAYTMAQGWHKNGEKSDDGEHFTWKQILSYMVNNNGIPYDVAIKELQRFSPQARKAKASGINALTGEKVQPTKTVANNQPQQAKVIQAAYKAGPGSGQVYVFGGDGTNGGFDCSGYTMRMVQQATGVNLPHNAAAQFNDPRGMKVPPGQLQPGDLVFFESRPNKGSSQPPWHVGYYIGNGQYIEYYSTGKPARVSSLSSRSDFMGARRFGSGARA